MWTTRTFEIMQKSVFLDEVVNCVLPGCVYTMCLPLSIGNQATAAAHDDGGGGSGGVDNNIIQEQMLNAKHFLLLYIVLWCSAILDAHEHASA